MPHEDQPAGGRERRRLPASHMSHSPNPTMSSGHSHCSDAASPASAPTVPSSTITPTTIRTSPNTSPADRMRRR